MAKLSGAKAKKAQSDAEKYKPKPENEDDPATNTQLWQLNRKGLLPKLIEQADDGIVTKLQAWQAITDATIAGVDFSDYK